MSKQNPKSLIILFACLLLVMSISSKTTLSIRGNAAAFFSPVWIQLAHTKVDIQSFWSITKELFVKDEKKEKEDIKKLQLQNQILQTELLKVKDLYNQIFHQSQYNSLEKNKDFISATVIYRSPTLWNSSLWIDCGEENNNPSKKIIARNSPVVVGNSLIGIIDYVGKKQSRVRLITDSGLVPSVRAARGKIQSKVLFEQLSRLIYSFKNTHIALDEQDWKALSKIYEKVNKDFHDNKDTYNLAKGELHGTGKPLWRSTGKKLKGIGFNYDFSDDEGPARDLRSGLANNATDEEASPILKVHDILVTTGMDGVFPPGLLVAQVTHVSPLKEGDYYYELEAKPLVDNLEDLTTVFVIPPCGYDEIEN
ncbi:MAG: hypothetical protein BGO10_02400 [Chlamydia sp. 32-24]|nr:MAG: hypothetical protein BGO10_02400 [Chlamydia sp. 32-24]